MVIKTSRRFHLLGVLALTLFFVAGSAWLLRLSLPGSAVSAAPAAPSALLQSCLSDDDVADAPYGSAPTVDGHIDPGEYAGAGKITFPGYGGDIEAFFKQDAITLYIALDSPDTTPYPFPSGGGTGPAFQVFLDTQNDKAALPQPDDYRLTLDEGGILMENQGDGSGWSGAGMSNWTAAAYSAAWGWQAEFAISLSKLGITQTGPLTIGLGLAEVWTPSWPQDWYWPSGGNWLDPSSWGYLVSSSEWSSFYWKPGPWEDYAPSGLPDFDQMQVAPTYCGPFAVANSLWWFDSKFEQNPVGPLPGGPPSTIPISDSYPLVWPYGSQDDHDPQNVVSLTLDLGMNYLNTDLFVPGTLIYDMYDGLQRYLRNHDLWDDYVVTLVNQPEFDWIAEEVQRSEDVILLLGFYEERPDLPSGWNRLGGHYVTLAGVDPRNYLLALSDPVQDWAEMGGWGRVLSGTLVLHQPIGGHTPDVHNDAGNVSHDIYPVVPSLSPGGLWALDAYIPPPFLLDIPDLNLNPMWPEPTQPFIGGFIHTEIEYALAVSPYDWKASGRWVEDKGVALYGQRFEPFDDFAPSGVPDIDQKQMPWGADFGLGWQWTYCGPVAAANSLWWFDSKFEFHGAVPPTISDTYPLVWPYAAWDDHNPDNVWSLVDELAFLADTDGRRTGDLHSGTVVTDLYHAIIIYTGELRQGYVITQVQRPEFWWVAEEVERSEDVILLLGFYAEVGPGMYERVGGHFVTVPGVDKQGSFIAFSDPYWDRMETVLHPNEFQFWPLWTGRVGSDGDLPVGPSGLVPTYTHTPLPHTGVYTLHNDAANVSHDVYRAVASTSPGGEWGPQGYVEVTDQITNFVGVNGIGSYVEPGYLVQTEVEWAIAVSPVADVWIDKEITPTLVAPGDWVTFTIRFGNDGNLAGNAVVSDLLHSALVSPSVVGTWNNYGGNIVSHDAYTWTVGDIPWRGEGLISVTARVDPGLSWPAETLITNTAEITTTAPEQYQLPTAPNSASDSFTVQTSDAWLNKWVTPSSLHRGDWLTFTLQYGANGPYPSANAVITDPMHLWLDNPAVVGTWNSYGGAIVTHDTYTWSVSNVPAGGWGAITITAQVSPSLMSAGLLTNTAGIAIDTFDRDPSNDESSVSASVLYSFSPSLTPDTAQDFGGNGDTVVYTFTVQNAGNANDSFSLFLAGADWPTALSTSGVGPLAPNATSTLWVSVTVPLTAAGGSFDQASVTAQSIASPTVSDTSAFTTTTTSHYIMSLAPSSDSRIDNPGQTVTYTLTLENAGNITDTYDLTTTLAAWPTSLSTSTVGPLGPWSNESFEVYVAIPGGASDGARDVVTVTAESQGSYLDDASVLTTIATTQTITRGVEIAPPIGANAGPPGSDVTYFLMVTNTGSITDGITLGASGNAWNTDLSPTYVSLPSLGNSLVTVTVTVPSTATQGHFDVVTITARASGVSDASVLTTTVAPPDHYDVALTPATDAEYESNGGTAVYTFTVQNVGNTWDSYNLSLAGDDWPTALSTAGAGPLSPGVTATLRVSVTVPLTAAGSTFDRASVIAQSVLSSTVSDSSTFTTTTIPHYSMNLDPSSDSRIDNPGQTVTYTLVLYNQGNITDTYDLTTTLTVWPTSLSASTVGPLGPWSDESFEVYVTIPGGASDGARDVVTVTAESQGSYLDDASLLTTIATTQIITRGVEIAPPTATGGGAAGDVVRYTLTVTNTGSVTDGIVLSASGQAWSTDLNPTTVSLPSMEHATLVVNVTISSTAAAGMSDTVTILAQATGVSDSSLLTTRVFAYLYLPTVLKAH